MTGHAAHNATKPVQPAPDSALGDGLSHQAFFYRGQRDYLAKIKAFADAGLANSEPVLIAVPGRNHRLLRDQLGEHVRYADMARLGRNPARIIPDVRAFIDANPGQRVRYVSEPTWPGLSTAEMCEAARHEALINLAFTGTAVTILCPYDAARLPQPVVGDAKRTHPAILANGHPVPAVHYAGPGAVPPHCERPLPAAPASAEALGYETSLQPVRRLVASHARQAGLPVERSADLVLAVSEITGNTLRHTGAGGTMHIWHNEEEILCQIQDQGWITDPLAGRIRRSPEQRGHGLWVVNQLCDLVELRTGQGGTTIRMHMRIRES
jgi:anti-sigma regulatory factor (Ser/Thr protein kinase)